MRGEADIEKEKKQVRISPFFYVCMAAGIVSMTYLANWGDTPLAAGLECAAGAALGIGVFYLGKHLFSCSCNTGEKNDESRKT